MRQNQFQQDVNQHIAVGGGFDIAALEQDMGHPTLAARLRARLFASRLDREVESGAAVVPGTPLAVHVARLTSAKQRRSLANSLTRTVEAAAGARPGVNRPFPIHSDQVAKCGPEIERITELLRSQRPVDPRGIARLRMLLADSTGPLYDGGSAGLAARLRAVLAAL